MYTDPLQHAIYQILNAPLRLYPYPHLFVEEVFPKDFYEKILSMLPDDRYYVSIDKLGKTTSKYETRKLLPLQSGFLENLEEEKVRFWKEFAKKLAAKNLLHALLTKFSLAKPEKERLELELVRDYQGYNLGPHTDADWKILTGLFYFPADNSLEDFGTTLVVPKRRIDLASSGKHLEMEDFSPVYTAPFTPNSFFCFLRGEHSWHAVDEYTLDTPRNSLCWRFIDQEKIPNRG